jgi:signal transduction histidine kinase
MISLLNTRKQALGTLKTNLIILIGIGLALLYWIIESVVMASVFNERTFIYQLFTPNTHELWSRLLVVFIIIAFSFFNQSILNKILQTRRELKDLSEQLATKSSVLDERVKELTCLYSISTLTEKPDISIQGTMQEIAQILPAAMQFTEIAGARIVLEGQEFKSTKWGKAACNIKTPITVFGKPIGLIELLYFENTETDRSIEFIPEERELLNVVSQRIGTLTEKFKTETELQEYRLKLESLIEKRTVELQTANFSLQKSLQRERKLRTKLESQMQENIKFVRMIVHELRTPLTTLVAASDLISADNKPEHIYSITRKINQGALELNNRINELFDLTRGEIGSLKLNFQLVSPDILFSNALKCFSQQAEQKNIALVADWSPELPQIRADYSRVGQVLNNLLDNAIKHTEENGRIALRAKQHDNMLLVKVEDNGCGIDPEKLDDIFKPYQRVEEGNLGESGMGLGLALCKMLVEMHGGSIWAESDRGAGSKFNFTLPVQKSLEEAS